MDGAVAGLWGRALSVRKRNLTPDVIHHQLVFLFAPHRYWHKWDLSLAVIQYSEELASQNYSLYIPFSKGVAYLFAPPTSTRVFFFLLESASFLILTETGYKLLTPERQDINLPKVFHMLLRVIQACSDGSVAATSWDWMWHWAIWFLKCPAKLGVNRCWPTDPDRFLCHNLMGVGSNEEKRLNIIELLDQEPSKVSVALLQKRYWLWLICNDVKALWMKCLLKSTDAPLIWAISWQIE